MKHTTKRSLTFNRVFWAIMLLLAAALILLDALGVKFGFLQEISAVRIVCGITLLYFVVRGIVRRSPSRIIFSLMLLFFLFERPIALLCGIESGELINNWLVLLVAALVVLAVELLRGKTAAVYVYNRSKEDDWEEEFEGEKNICGNFTKYIDCTQFTRETVSAALGHCEVFFQNTENYLSGGTLEVSNKFGAMEIYVPEEWRVEISVDNAYGTILVPRSARDGSEKVLSITGKNRFGKMEIRRI